MQQTTCAQCDQDFAAPRKDSRFCGRTCAARWYREHSTSQCTTDGCAKSVLAKALCATHYNQTRKNRHRKAPHPCCVCGVTVMRRVDKSREGSYCCSVECRRVRQFGVALGTTHVGYSWTENAKQRARRFGTAVIEDVDREAVFARDDWRCYLCARDTREATSPFDPRSATVDHVVALSMGGEHSMRNVRCCCLACNCSKAHREGVGLQPMAPAA